MIRLILAYLNSGITDYGVIQPRYEGTLQGGPLSPLLANILLDEVSKEMGWRGHCFARYTDDAKVYVRSKCAGKNWRCYFASLASYTSWHKRDAGG